MYNFSETVIITGHYGSGKTNLALNLALDLRSRGGQVTLADLDIVNPYFRTADFQEIAREKDIHLVTPAYANSSVDIPSLTGELDARLHQGGTVIIDVGGDDDGAHALGRYAPRILQRPYEMLFVVNFFRNLTKTPQEALTYLAEIEAASRLKVTHLVNNSNLADQTTPEELAAAQAKAEELAALSGRPLLFTAARRELAAKLADTPALYPVEIYVKTPWQ